MTTQKNKKNEIKKDDREPLTSHTMSDSKKDPKKSSMSTVHKIVLFCSMSFVYFLTFCNVALWAPFLPGEAVSRGVSSTAVGWIIGIYNLLCVIFSLFYGSFVIPRTGPQKVLLFGLVLNGTSYIICGFAGHIQDPVQFVVFFLIVRSIGAIGAAACDTSIVVTLTQEFSERVSLITGFREFSIGTGYILGPVFGGGLYSIGGFYGPMFTLAGLMFTATPIIWFLLPKREYATLEDRTGRIALFKEVSTTPAIIILSLTTTITTVSGTFLDPIFQPYVANKYGLDSLGVSLLFLIAAIMNTLTAPLMGCILNKTSLNKIVLVTGLFGFGTCLLFLGPSPLLFPYLPDESHTILMVNMMFIGLFTGSLIVPILPEMLHFCQTAGIQDSLKLQSIVSALYTGSIYLGAFLGPVLSGVINDHYGFPWTCTVIGFVCAGQGLVDWVFFLLNRCRSSSECTGEKQKLIDQ